MYINSISPSNMNQIAGRNDGTLLSPTITSGNDTNATSSSPLPAYNASSRKTPESFLGDQYTNLVSLDELVTDIRSKEEEKEEI